MEVDTTQQAGTGRWNPEDIERAVRAALSCVQTRLECVVVEVIRSAESHVCRLRARAERGQVVAVECRATSLGEAIESAADALENALERAPAERCSGAECGGMHSAGLRSSRLRIEASSAARAAAHRAVDGFRCRLLLAAGDSDVPRPSLHWAAVLGNALHADLDVYRWMPRAPAPSCTHASSLRASAGRLAALERMRRWHALELPQSILSERAISGAGGFTVEAARLARCREVDWIIMPAHDGCGAAAAMLAQAAGCPVLVARAPTTRSVMLVATEAQQDNSPILTRAARLALALRSSVKVLHDLSAMPVTGALTTPIEALAGPWARSSDLSEGSHSEGQISYLRECLPELEILFTRGGERVATVIERGRREDAEIIVLGVAGCEPGATSSRVAAEVAERALRSVLIVPRERPATAATGSGPNSSATRLAPTRRNRRPSVSASYLSHAIERRRDPAAGRSARRWPRGAPSGGSFRR